MNAISPSSAAAQPDWQSPATDISDALVAEEREGFRRALTGRLYALLAISGLLPFLTPFPEVLYYHGLIAVFAVIGLLANYFQNQIWFKPWHHYLFVMADFGLITFTVLYPNPLGDSAFPPQTTYQNGNAIYLFVLLVGLAFSYRPRLVLWGGLAGALSWGLGLLWILSLPETTSILSIDSDAFSAAPFDYLTQPTFVDLGVRLQELVIFAVCASLIAIIVMRSRNLVLRQVTAERERHFVREALGKYVPVSVANAIVADRGVLKPQRQTATMLFADIEGFTGLVERTDPAEVFAILNDYFAAIGAAIVDQGGVINQFQGDAVLATFNLPVEDPDHAAAAVRAALGIRQACQNQAFASHTIRSRVGIATGEVIAGSVGSGSQLAYTVHGDAVNLAARLEQMNKEIGTTILIAGETVRAAGEGLEAQQVGEIPIRGRAAADVYSI